MLEISFRIHFILLFHDLTIFLLSALRVEWLSALRWDWLRISLFHSDEQLNAFLHRVLRTYRERELFRVYIAWCNALWIIIPARHDASTTNIPLSFCAWTVWQSVLKDVSWENSKFISLLLPYSHPFVMYPKKIFALLFNTWCGWWKASLASSGQKTFSTEECLISVASQVQNRSWEHVTCIIIVTFHHLHKLYCLPRGRKSVFHRKREENKTCRAAL